MYLRHEIRKVYPEREASSMASLILEHLGFSSSFYLAEPNHRPGQETVVQINEIVNEIHTRAPIQYILGETIFCEINIAVNENVLIPRPETEEMVYRIINSTTIPPSCVIDLGTGSGCIALALKKAFPSAEVTGVDRSVPALALARENGENNGLEVAWMTGDMLDPVALLHGDSPFRPGAVDLVVSNPPYVTRVESGAMDRNVLDFEPRDALFVEEDDPLQYYRTIGIFAREALRAGGVLWIEINERFGRETAALMGSSGFQGITIHRDIHEKERFIEARK